MEKNDLNISIIIPCHNEAGTITETIGQLDRIMKTCDGLYEIIVVDDASTDNTGAQLKGLDKPHVRILSNPHQRGYGGSIKAGIKQSKFRWIGICDADGTYPLDRFPDLLKDFKKFTEVIILRPETLPLNIPDGLDKIFHLCPKLTV